MPATRPQLPTTSQASTASLRPTDLSIRQAAAELSVSRDTVKRLIRTRQLQAYNASPNPNAKRPTIRIRYASILQFKERRDVAGRVTLKNLLRDL